MSAFLTIQHRLYHQVWVTPLIAATCTYVVVAYGRKPGYTPGEPIGRVVIQTEPPQRFAPAPAIRRSVDALHE